MPYMLLIVEPAGQRAQRSEAQGRELYDVMLRFADMLKERGLLIDAQSLRSDAEGVRVQVRGGKPNYIDGPFAETKEIVGGFFLLDCEERAVALELAAECPAAEWATVEVRALGPCFT
ncbi:YciI family protein [Aquisalimonas sp.]|uniref:YciI family protein n=1 Tax=Aquisalimonas sp. TaxID=1872621 RepID=UPI0025C26A7F|nr:YciI family protein [Aquisalimonas sp.]